MSYGGCTGMSMGGGCYGGVKMMPITQPEKIPTKPNPKTSMTPAPATIVVDLPADAKLLIDDKATTSTGANRVFQSPVLNPGKTYHYNFTAEVVREGKPVRIDQVVEIVAGETKPVRITLPVAGVAQH